MVCYNIPMSDKPLVLLVDDEEVFLEIASVKLQAEGFATVLAQGAREGFEVAERMMPDLVLSDIYMPPGPSGWELALELRRNPKTATIKVAFFTSLRDPWIEFRGDRKTIAEELGSVTFFSKTDDVDRLGDEIKKLVQASAG